MTAMFLSTPFKNKGFKIHSTNQLLFGPGCVHQDVTVTRRVILCLHVQSKRTEHKMLWHI